MAFPCNHGWQDPLECWKLVYDHCIPGYTASVLAWQPPLLDLFGRLAAARSLKGRCSVVETKPCLPALLCPQNRNAIPKDILYNERKVRGSQGSGPRMRKLLSAAAPPGCLPSCPADWGHGHSPAALGLNTALHRRLWQVVEALYKMSSGNGDFGSPPRMPAGAQFSRLCVADPERAGSGNCKKASGSRLRLGGAWAGLDALAPHCASHVSSPLQRQYY